MNGCDEGTLRAYLDGELPAPEHQNVAAHLTGCPACRAQLATLQTQTDTLTALLSEPVQPPEPHMALHRLHASLGAEEHQPPEPIPFIQLNRRNRMKTSLDRGIAAALAAVVVLAGLLALPPVRAMADQLLSVFRVEQVVFVPVSTERLEELEALDLDESMMFMSEPETIEDPGEPYTVGSVAEAEEAVGYDLGEISTLPREATSSEITVMNQSAFQFEVNVENSRQVLELLEIDDVTIPDALGDTPIVVEVPATASMSYAGENYELQLHQGISPEVTLPEGVDLAELGKATLRVLGMSEEQAEMMSQQIDWGTTFVFPFPADIDNVNQVTINGAQGILVESDWDDEARWHLYWQQDDRFYVLTGTGFVGSTEMVLAAESLQ
jgi:hypothetical protein